MCLTVLLYDLGPADALLDLDEGMLVLRPSNTPTERTLAARTILTRNGVEQTTRGVAICFCGEVLFAGPAAGSGQVAGLVAASAAALTAAVLVLVPLAVAESAAAESPPPTTTVDESTPLVASVEDRWQ